MLSHEPSVAARMNAKMNTRRLPFDDSWIEPEVKRYPRVSMATRAVVPASAVQPDVASRVMEAMSDLILEVKLTVRPKGAS